MRWRRQQKPRWLRKQELAAPDWFYGDDMTIHGNTSLDIETFNGVVVAVWFRCQAIAFKQFTVDIERATEMLDMPSQRITGVQLSDDQPSAIL